jgi:hypothetical protein
MVIGVVPARFQFPRKFEIWKPLALDPVKERRGEKFRLIQLIGRLAPGFAIENAAPPKSARWSLCALNEK